MIFVIYFVFLDAFNFFERKIKMIYIITHAETYTHIFIYVPNILEEYIV